MNNFTQILNPNNPILYVILAWAVIWKGIALWHSARNNQPAWYIVILLVNTVGI